MLKRHRPKMVAVHLCRGIRPGPPSLTDSKSKSCRHKSKRGKSLVLSRVPQAIWSNCCSKVAACKGGVVRAHIFAERKRGVSLLDIGARVSLLHTGVLVLSMIDTSCFQLDLQEVGDGTLTTSRTALLSSSGSFHWTAVPTTTNPSCLSARSQTRFATGDSGAVQTMDFTVLTMSPALVRTCSMCWMTRSATDVDPSNDNIVSICENPARFVLKVPLRASVREIRRDTDACPRQSLLVLRAPPCGIPAAVGILVQMPSCSRTQSRSVSQAPVRSSGALRGRSLS